MSKFFQKSEEIGIELNKFLLEYYQNIKTPVFDEIENGNFIYKLYQDYFIDRKLKVKKGHYRANLVYIAAKILLGKNKSIQELLPCMAAVELCMWSAYTYNWIIDNKNINSQNPKKRLSELVAIGYLMHNDILKLDLKSETKIYIFTEWFQNIGLAYAAENYTRITDFENISDAQLWKMDNFVGAMSNGVLNQICF